ncbi:hypothetical protein DL96DRAFT_272437 [Flagelloscypha sp. PMI_526]|nr:hypothetical protein DL96DRAFT_272437 [Flagelloscypha sp. PMI_526]
MFRQLTHCVDSTIPFRHASRNKSSVWHVPIVNVRMASSASKKTQQLPLKLFFENHQMAYDPMKTTLSQFKDLCQLRKWTNKSTPTMLELLCKLQAAMTLHYRQTHPMRRKPRLGCENFLFVSSFFNKFNIIYDGRKSISSQFGYVCEQQDWTKKDLVKKRAFAALKDMLALDNGTFGHELLTDTYRPTLTLNGKLLKGIKESPSQDSQRIKTIPPAKDNITTPACTTVVSDQNSGKPNGRTIHTVQVKIVTGTIRQS